MQSQVDRASAASLDFPVLCQETRVLEHTSRYMLDSLHAWGGFPKRLLLGEADVTAHSYLYKTSYNAANRHGQIGVHYTTCKLLSPACWCRAHLVEWSHQGFARFLLQYGNRAPFSCRFQQTSGQYRSLSKRANLKEPDILYDQAFHRVA